MRKVFGSKKFRRSVIGVIGMYLIGLLFGTFLTTGQASSIDPGAFLTAAQSCSEQTVDLDYTPELDVDTGNTAISNVTAGVQDALGCAGRTLTVTVGEAGKQLATGSAKISQDVTVYVVSLDKPVPLAEAQDVTVALSR